MFGFSLALTLRVPSFQLSAPLVSTHPHACLLPTGHSVLNVAPQLTPSHTHTALPPQDFASSLDALARFATAARAPTPLPAAGAAGAAAAAPALLMPPGIAEGHLAVVDQARKVGAMDLVPSRPPAELPGACFCCCCCCLLPRGWWMEGAVWGQCRGHVMG